jgi:hypothetical protein
MSTAAIIPVSSIINISTSLPQPGLTVQNIANMCLISWDAPVSTGPNYATLHAAPWCAFYTTATAVGLDFGTTSETYYQAVAIFNERPNILAAGGVLMVFNSAASTGANLPLLKDAIPAIERLGYVGVYLPAGTTYTPVLAEFTDGAGVTGTLGKILGVASATASDVTTATTGIINAMCGTTLYQGATGMYFGQGATLTLARCALAARISYQLATNYYGSNTCINMNLKTLNGITPDSTLTGAIEAAIGAPLNGTTPLLACSVYANIGGVGGLIESGGANNLWLDNQTNMLAFQNALQIAYFNVLKTTSTKIPQTERGMTDIKNALINVCAQFVTNGFLAPGTWASTDTFGDVVAFTRNILQLGYYVYSQPMGQQVQSVRVTRAAPLVQLAGKLAGGINTGSVLVNFNP